MNLYLVRHGQTNCNLQGKYMGSFEDELSLQGIEEIKKTKELIKNVSFDKVFSSERKRAVQSAKLLTDKEIACDYRLNERDFGIFENKSYQEICGRYPVERQAWEEDWVDYRIPHGESVREAYQRVEDFLKALEKEKFYNCLAVTHGGIIRLVYCYILGGNLDNFWRFTSKNGGLSVIKYEYDNWYIDSIIHI